MFTTLVVLTVVVLGLTVVAPMVDRLRKVNAQVTTMSVPLRTASLRPT